MSEKVKRARELFLEGYNCSQAVVGAFCRDLGLDFDVAMRLSSSFGGGMGRMREVCGAVSGAFLVIGLACGYDSPTDKDAKSEHYKRIRETAEAFRAKRGSIICRELLEKKKGEAESHIPDDRTASYYAQRPCLAIVEEMTAITEEVLRREAEKDKRQV